MLKKLLRVPGYTLLILVWVLPLVLAAELFVRYRHQAALPQVEAMKRGQWDTFTAEEQAIIRRYGEGAIPFESPRNGFADQSPEERRAYARKWNETVFACDAEGRIHEVYRAQAPEEVVALTKPLQPGDSVLPLFPQKGRNAAARQIKKSAAERNASWKRYAIELPNGEPHQFKIAIEPLHRNGGGPPVGVFVRRHIFKRPYSAYYPNAFEITNQRFSTNRFGWRDGPIEVPKPGGQYRIVCVGGSTTVEGPTNALTYPNILEQKLQETFPETDIEVVNCGVYGINAAGERNHAADYLALDPDLILYYSFGNDLTYDVPNWFKGGGFLADPCRSFKWTLRGSRLVSTYLNWWRLPSERRIQQFYRDVPLGSVEELVETVREAGVDVVLCGVDYADPQTLSPEEEAYMDYEVARFVWEGQVSYGSFVRLTRLYNAMLEDLARALGVPFLPAAEALQGGMDYYYDPFHMTLAGIEAKAEVLHGLLMDRLLDEAVPAAAQSADDGVSR